MIDLQHHRDQGAVTRVLVHKKANCLDNTIRSFEQCLALQSSDGFALTNLAHIYWMHNHLKLAHEFVEKALKAAPQNRFAIGLCGGILRQMGDLAGAAAAYEEEIANAPQRTYPYLQFGVICRKLGRLQDALKTLQQGIELDPKLGRLHHALGDVYVALRQTEQATGVCQRALDLDPDDEYAFTRWIDLQVRNQSFQQAINQLRQLLKIPSRYRNSHLHAQLGLQLKKQGAYKEATEEIEITVKLKPNSVYFRTQLAFCYSKQEVYHKLLPLLEQVFEILSEDTQIIGAMAKAYFHLGELDRAK